MFPPDTEGLKYDMKGYERKREGHGCREPQGEMKTNGEGKRSWKTSHLVGRGADGTEDRAEGFDVENCDYGKFLMYIKSDGKTSLNPPPKVFSR